VWSRGSGRFRTRYPGTTLRESLQEY